MVRRLAHGGQLRNFITIEQLPATLTPDAFGNTEPATDTTAWTTLDKVHAKIIPKGAREFYAADEITAETTHKIVIRYRSDVTKLMQIKLGTRTFQFIGPPINENERGEWLIIMAKEV